MRRVEPWVEGLEYLLLKSELRPAIGNSPQPKLERRKEHASNLWRSRSFLASRGKGTSSCAAKSPSAWRIRC